MAVAFPKFLFYFILVFGFVVVFFFPTVFVLHHKSAGLIKGLKTRIMDLVQLLRALAALIEPWFSS